LAAQILLSYYGKRKRRTFNLGGIDHTHMSRKYPSKDIVNTFPWDLWVAQVEMDKEPSPYHSLLPQRIIFMQRDSSFKIHGISRLDHPYPYSSPDEPQRYQYGMNQLGITRMKIKVQ
jgi:hypothetical protein